MPTESSQPQPLGYQQDEKMAPSSSHGSQDKAEATTSDFKGAATTTTSSDPAPVNVASLDEGAKLMMEFADLHPTQEQERAVLKKIDWHLLPLMCLLYAIQFADKTSLGSSSILGIKTDNDLTTARYNDCSAFLYITYLAFEWPANLALQRFPTGRILSLAATSWAVLLLCHLASNSYGGLLTLRMALGATEAFVTPGFLIMVSAYYKLEEQASRTGYWFLMNGFATIFNALVAYGAQFITIGSWAPWRAFFLILGLLGVVVAGLFWAFCPNTPADAWFLTRQERAIALKRIEGNQSGSKNKHFKKYQLIEALKDPKVWLFCFFSIFANIPNSLTQQRSIIIQQFGFTTLQTSLLNIPTGVLEMLTIPAATYMARKWKNGRAHVMAIWTIPSLIGSSMLIGLGQDQKNARLVAVYLAPLNTAAFVISLAWCSSCAAGTTKRGTANAMNLMAYCVGNLIGPQLWQSQYSPQNIIPWSIILVSYFLCIPIAYTLHYLMAKENRRRDALVEAGEPAVVIHGSDHDEKVIPTEDQQVTVRLEGEAGGNQEVNAAWLDLTDGENVRYYRYPL